MIRRARRDGREARGNEEREKREDEKGSHCFFKSSGYLHVGTKMQLNTIIAHPTISVTIRLILNEWKLIL